MTGTQVYSRREGGPLQLQTNVYEVMQAPIDRVSKILPHAMEFLSVGLSVAPELSMRTVGEGLADGSIQLWLVIDLDQELVAAFLTSIEKVRADWVVSLYALAGTEVRGWLSACDRAMTEFALREGAVRVRMCGRKAWTRLLPSTFRVTGERGGHNVYERDVQ
jgi:hypothetical protein